MKKKCILIPIILIPLIVIIDQLSKYIIVKNIPLGFSEAVIPNFFYLSTFYNTGAAFGILSNSTTALILITGIIFICLIIELIRCINSKFSTLSYSLIMGGLIGNLIDRVLFGYVRDFFHFIIFSHNFAIFNVADAFIVIGTILLAISFVLEAKNENNSN